MSIFANAQSGYKIDIKLNNYNNDTLLLGYYLGDKQFVKDTAISHNGTFTFKGVKDLDPGVYMAVMLPEKNVFQFIVDKTANLVHKSCFVMAFVLHIIIKFPMLNI